MGFFLSFTDPRSGFTFFIFLSLGQVGGAGNFPESESGLLPQAKDLEPEGSSLTLPPKRALDYGKYLSLTEPPERSGFIPAVCVRFTSPRLHNDINGRIVKSAKSALRNKSRPLLTQRFLEGGQVE
jgi:hypothetical protein